MRALEISLLAALAVSILYDLLSDQSKWEWRNSILPVSSLLIFFLHAFWEGTRWQLVPAYAVLTITVLINLTQFIATRKNIPDTKQGCLDGLITFLGTLSLFLLLSVSLFLSIVLPIYHMPAPSGNYPVGVQDLYLVDVDRPEFFTPDETDHRELMVRVWYPARPDANARPESAWPDMDRAGPPLLKRLGLPTFLLSHLSLVRSYSFPGAPLADDVGAFPVLIFSHGYTDDIAGHQTLMEELASHGYIVFSLGHTYESMTTIFPDGRIILADNLKFSIKIGDLPNHHTPRDIYLDDELSVWDEDAIFLLDRLEDFNSGKMVSSFTRRLDMDKVGIFGMSFGGAMSMDVCLRDSRCKAGANIDGSQFGYINYSVEHLNVPFLFFYNEGSEGMNDHVYNGVENWAYRVTVAGATHSSFTDKVLWSPYIQYASTFSNQSFGPIPADRVVAVQRAYLLAFFDRHLLGRETPLLDGPSRDFPEVSYRFHQP